MDRLTFAIALLCGMRIYRKENGVEVTIRTLSKFSPAQQVPWLLGSTTGLRFGILNGAQVNGLIFTELRVTENESAENAVEAHFEAYVSLTNRPTRRVKRSSNLLGRKNVDLCIKNCAVIVQDTEMSTPDSSVAMQSSGARQAEAGVDEQPVCQANDAAAIRAGAGGRS